MRATIAVDLGHDRLTLGPARFEQLDDAQQTLDLLFHHPHELLDNASLLGVEA